jgi:hypothetical protein
MDVDSPAATAPSMPIVPRPVLVSSQSTHGESRLYPNPPTQRRFTQDFKARVALAAAHGDKTAAELAGRFVFHAQSS